MTTRKTGCPRWTEAQFERAVSLKCAYVAASRMSDWSRCAAIAAIADREGIAALMETV